MLWEELREWKAKGGEGNVLVSTDLDYVSEESAIFEVLRHFELTINTVDVD